MASPPKGSALLAGRKSPKIQEQLLHQAALLHEFPYFKEQQYHRQGQLPHRQTKAPPSKGTFPPSKETAPLSTRTALYLKEQLPYLLYKSRSPTFQRDDLFVLLSEHWKTVRLGEIFISSSIDILTLYLKRRLNVAL
jgi:hypothetical protein